MATPFDSFVTTANRVYHQVLNVAYPETEEEKLVSSINQAYAQWKNAESRFNEATDQDLIDHAIYDMLAAKTQYTYLLKTAKEKSISR